MINYMIWHPPARVGGGDSCSLWNMYGYGGMLSSITVTVMLWGVCKRLAYPASPVTPATSVCHLQSVGSIHEHERCTQWLVRRRCPLMTLISKGSLMPDLGCIPGTTFINFCQLFSFWRNRSAVINQTDNHHCTLAPRWIAVYWQSLIVREH